MTREALKQELCEMCRAEGLDPDDAKISKVFASYTTEEIGRLIEAFARFGVKDVLQCV